MASIFELKDDVETVSFVSSTYRYEDNTFEADMPQRNETRYESMAGGARDLLTMSYSTRRITFDFLVEGASDSAVRDAISKINRMLIRASSDTYLAGGAYQQQTTMTDGSNTGDTGLILRMRLAENPSGATIKNEYGQTVAATEILTYRIISGDLKHKRQMSAVRTKDTNGTKKYFAQCTLNLEAEPFILGEPRIIFEETNTTNYFFSEQASDTDQKYSRVFIPAANIPGDAPALTRITTKITNSLGIILARDAGISILNSTTAPKFTGTGNNDMFCYGQIRANNVSRYIVKITNTGTPNKFQYSTNNGSSFNGVDINITPMIAQQLGSNNIWVFFWTDTGHDLNDQWYFLSNQAQIRTGLGSVNIWNNKSTALGENGHGLGAVTFTVPRGCKSKYKIYAQVPAGLTDYELRMQLSYMGYSSGPGKTFSSGMFYDWVTPESEFVDLGLLDLTGRGSPFNLQPDGFIEGVLSVYIRAIQYPEVTATAQFVRLYFIPAQDEYSFLHAAWAYDDDGREVYCNFDPSNPYIGEIAANYLDVSSATIGNVVGLNSTYAGNVITLEPGIDNTLLILPLEKSTSTMDWRLSFPNATCNSGKVSVAIRPRYLYGG